MKKTTYLHVNSANLSSGVPENMSIILGKTVPQVTKVSLSSFSFHNSIYNITSLNNVLAWQDTSLHSEMLTPGFYTVSDFMSAIQTTLNTYRSQTYTVTYNPVMMLMTIRLT